MEKASGTLDGEPDYWLGLAYMYSHKNDVLMRRHFTIAAEAGHEEAAWLLEILFQAHTFTAEEAFANGNEAFQNQKYKEALDWWGKADARGSAHAALQLGMLYQKGQIVNQDMKKALAYYLKAAEMGNVTAQCMAGLLYSQGKDGIEQDRWKAFHLYRSAAERGYDTAQLYLASGYICGDGGVKDYAKGLDCEWRLMKLYLELGEYEQAAFWAKEHDKKMGGRSAEGTLKYRAENIYYQAVQEFQKKHFAEARELAKNAIILGNTDAMLLYGTTYDEGFGIDADKEKVLYWYKKAAENGSALAQYTCGEMYCKGEGLDRQYTVTGLYWYEKAAAQGMLDAQKKCAEIFMEGTAIRPDKSRARYWYEKAAEQGDAFAQVKCADLYLEPPVSAKYAKIARMYYEKAAAQTEKPKIQAYAKKQLALMTKYDM